MNSDVNSNKTVPQCKGSDIRRYSMRPLATERRVKHFCRKELSKNNSLNVGFADGN